MSDSTAANIPLLGDRRSRRDRATRMCALATPGPLGQVQAIGSLSRIFLSGELPDAVSSLDVVFADGERAAITPTQGFFAYPI